MQRYFSLEKPIVALSTPQGQSAVGILKLSGHGLGVQVAQFFSKADQLLNNPRKMIHGFFLDTLGNNLDEIMMVMFTHPYSYTGEDVIEIFFHGNMRLAENMIDVLMAYGFEMALPGEFTYRAVMNGKIDLIKAEAIHEIVTSKTLLGCQLALKRLEGGLTTFFWKIYNNIIEYMSWIRMHLDYPENEIEVLPKFDFSSIISELHMLIGKAEKIKKWQEGARVVLIGAPNVGKSSLFNLLLGYNRAIVSNIAGTTRDYLEADIDILGYPLRVVDTAGIRESEDTLENLGINLSLSLLNDADLIICLLDQNNQGISQDLEIYKDKILFVMNKSDLGYKEIPADDILTISVLDNKNIDKLLHKIIEHLNFTDITESRQQLMLGSLRQKQYCEIAYENLITVQKMEDSGDLDIISFHLEKASLALSDLLGKNTYDDVNSAMFSRFCLGK